MPIETPIQPKMDVSPFQRVFIAGFLAGGSEDVDANLETVRLLRSQLRSKSPLRVIDADVLPLLELASEQRPEARDRRRRRRRRPRPDRRRSRRPPPTAQPPRRPQRRQPAASRRRAAPPHQGRKGSAAARAASSPTSTTGRRSARNIQNPLIVTGTVLFTPHARSGFVQREQEVYDQLGRRRVVPVRTYMERKGFILRPKFIFIDGRTGTTLYSEASAKKCSTARSRPRRRCRRISS